LRIARDELRRRIAPRDEILFDEVWAGLLHELKSQPGRLARPVQKHRESLMRMILGVVDEHDGKCGARPIAIGFLTPDLAELGNDAPVAKGRSGAAFAHHLAALYGYQNVADRKELQLHARKDAGVAPLNQRLRKQRQRLHRCGMHLDRAGERGRRECSLIGHERGIHNRRFERPSRLESLLREKLCRSGARGAGIDDQPTRDGRHGQHTSQPHIALPEN
jgi:hypothetical protein